MKPHCCTLPKFKNVTHVIFDLDGTLLDSESIYMDALARAAEDYGKTFDPIIPQKVAGSVQTETARITREFLGIEASNEEFLDKFNNYANEKLDNCDLMPGAEKVVRHLYDSGIPIAIGTSSNEDAVARKTKKHQEVFDLFDHTVCAGTDPDVKNGKPAPDVFLICAERFSNKPNPESCLVFEDSVNGVKAALNAGMQVVMIPDQHVPYELWKLATLRLDSFDYMVPELFGLPPYPKDDVINQENI